VGSRVGDEYPSPGFVVSELATVIGAKRGASAREKRASSATTAAVPPRAELLLTKLQVVEANLKDLKDMWALLLEHPVAEGDDETINGPFIARLLAGDWGLWRTATGTIDKLRVRLATDSGLEAEQQRVIAERLDTLSAGIDDAQKSLRWRTRAKVGERVRWYAEPEGID
jgi:hypothetical protein